MIAKMFRQSEQTKATKTDATTSGDVWTEPRTINVLLSTLTTTSATTVKVVPTIDGTPIKDGRTRAEGLGNDDV